MKRLPLKAAIAIVIVAMLALIAFTAMMVIRDGFTMDTIGKSGVILMGLVVTLIRLLIQGGAERGLKFYARAYEKELHGAFLHDDQRTVKVIEIGHKENEHMHHFRCDANRNTVNP